MAIFAAQSAIMWKERIPGFLLVLGLGIAATLLAPFIPGTNEVLLGLILGVLAGNLRPLAPFFEKGVAFAGVEGLNLSVIFLGFGISFGDIQGLGGGMVALLVAVVFSVLLLTWGLARLFRCKTTTGWLVGFGTAICGSSAIAALSGSVTKDNEDAGIALAVVNLLGLAGMLGLPLAFGLLGLSDNLQATLLGATLHSVGNVAGAAYGISDHVGDLAITVKLGRVALLAPGLIFFNFLVNRSASVRDNLRLPYYIWGFILAVSAVSLFGLPESFLGVMDQSGKALLTLAMAAIGLRIGIAKLVRTGGIAFVFGLVIFALQLGLVTLLALWWLP